MYFHKLSQLYVEAKINLANVFVLQTRNEIMKVVYHIVEMEV